MKKPLKVFKTISRQDSKHKHRFAEEKRDDVLVDEMQIKYIYGMLRNSGVEKKHTLKSFCEMFGLGDHQHIVLEILKDENLMFRDE